ncbi:Tectonic-1 [Histomonas meleagridis]|uniref:Tectonic-1 n=1 Tax=Histomonas meleagridis TaxID=135588 RepID=UPI0035598CD5|nr:Tectonic-1 [Histomonas meleagridis]KAH0798638.1 Tectonic-1 [Histomonas meleagridis]
MLVFFLPYSFSLGLVTIEKDMNLTDESLYYQTTSDRDPDSTTFIITENTDYGECSCDVTNQCDPNCCCDPDCPQNIRNNFEKCLPQISTNSIQLCSELDDDQEGSLARWLVRTMLCVHKNNNPSPGDYYVLTPNSISDPRAVNSENVQYSFRDIFTTQTITTVSPYNNLNQNVIRRGSDGYCESQAVRYLESVSESCIVPTGMTEDYCLNVLGGSSFSGSCTDARTSISWSNASYTTQSGAGNFAFVDSSSIGTVSEGDVIQISIQWATNPNAVPNTNAGYKFGDTVVTGSSGIVLTGPNSNGECEQGNVPLQFGLSKEFSCNVPTIAAQGMDFSNTDSPFYFTYTEFNQIPNQNIAKAINISPNITDTLQYSLVSHLVQEISVFYKAAGLKSNPQYYIEEMNVRYYASSSNNAYAGNLNSTKVTTSVLFYEYPNDVNTNPQSSANKLKTWTPFDQ